MSKFPLFLALLLLASCSSQKNFQEAERASDDFHLQVAKGNYGGIYDSAGSGVKSAATRDQLIAMLREINSKMGTCGEAMRQGFNMNVNTGGTFVTLVYTRKCVNGSLEEQFTWLMEDGRAVLHGYHYKLPPPKG
jgi:hypothetical protein